MTLPDLPELELAAQEIPRNRRPRPVWHLATNQLNLMFMLAAGLVTGPKGFGRKYYLDPLSVAPGWIPLFAERLPPAALGQATSEESHLLGVAAEIDLRALRGPIRALDERGRLRELQWPDEARGDERMLFIPAPVPIAWLGALLFPSKEVRAAVREQAADYANVPMGAYRQPVRAALFRPGPAPSWPVEGLTLPDRDQSPHRVSAIGAVQALLVGLGNRGNALVEAARRLADAAGTAPVQADDPLLRAVLQWADGAGAPEEGEVQTRILIRTLEAIVGARADADGSAEAWCPPDIHQAVLGTLDEERQRLTEPKWREALARLIDDLKGLLGLGDATASDLLERHSRPFSRGLILFFLRRHCDDLLDMARDQRQLTDQDLVVAAALFGARSGWIGLPPGLKDTPGLTAATTHRMAAMAHRGQGSGLDLGPAPPRVRPLLELLAADESGWTKRQRAGALRLARGLGWQGVLKTRISLGKGDYRLQVDGRGAHLLIDGDVKAVHTEVDPGPLLDSLAKVAVPPKLEADVRSVLER
jgi:hypothetical protein